MSEGSSAASPPAQPEPTARYRSVGELGGGGMATVYEALDPSGRRLALKRPHLRGSATQQQRYLELFTREFHTLYQLAHPHVVSVYDYAVDEQGPFYTMELLDGGDLQGLIPLEHRQLCAIARDVCSALSLIHSRRIVHRDISPRNVRCTADGRTKLIDFGAMTTMGASKELVGTPAYCAPEVFHLETLDARTDLYALGATLYYALTGHHPYPARDFASLPKAWLFGVARPSELASGVPEALDALVLDLLQLDPNKRPSSAAEVRERLGAIVGSVDVEQTVVADAYLAVPSFVGRVGELAKVRNKLGHTVQQRGSAMLVLGPSGVGRSRFLEASLLNAKLLGLSVIRADADDAADGDYGALRRLVRQLLQILPGLTRSCAQDELPVLGQLIPELVEGRNVLLAQFETAIAQRQAQQAALRKLLIDVSQHKPLVIALDDLHQVDEPSAAVLALMARSIRVASLTILATVNSDAELDETSPVALFRNAASAVRLQPLAASESQSLLGSVFGQSPESAALSQRLHGLASGSPRDLMRLARHLVERGVLRYEHGTWSVPAELPSDDLPSSVAEVLQARLAELGAHAWPLACALSLSPEQGFGFAECQRLSGHEQPTELMRDLEQLLLLEVLHFKAERYVLSDRAWVPLLAASMSAELTRSLQLRLAQVFAGRDGESFREAQHLFRAGELALALDRFIAHAIASRALTDRDARSFIELVRSLPKDWRDSYELAIVACEQVGRPARDAFELRSRFASLGAVIDVSSQQHTATLLVQLSEACGLADYARLSPQLPAADRLRQALGLAAARYEATPERDRVLDPRRAIGQMANAIRYALSYNVQVLNIPALQTLPSIAPFTPLSPALILVENLVRGVRARVTGQSERARSVYAEMLERTAAPDGLGIEASHLAYTRLLLMNALGLIEASLGLASALEWADRIETDALFSPNAALIRMLYYLWQGNCQQADRSKKKVELLRLQNSGHQASESTHLLWQVSAHAAMEDLTRIRRSLDEIAPLAERHPGWRPASIYAKAEYQRARGDAQNAATLLAAELETLHAGDHQLWSALAGAHVRALDDSQRTEDAERLGVEYLAAAERAELGVSALPPILLPLAVAQARLSRSAAAATVERVIAHCQQIGATGLNLALAHETRARVAVLQDDADAYAQHYALCHAEFAKAENPALLARLERLAREAQRRGLVSGPARPIPALPRGLAETALRSRLHGCAGAAERAHALLTALADASGAREGLLYHLRGHGPTCVASLGSCKPDETLHAMVREFILAETNKHDVTSDMPETGGRTDWTAFGDALYRPVLLSHYVDEACVITGLAVFVVKPTQMFVYPSEAACQVSRMTRDSGDATGVVVNED